MNVIRVPVNMEYVKIVLINTVVIVMVLVTKEIDVIGVSVRNNCKSWWEDTTNVINATH